MGILRWLQRLLGVRQPAWGQAPDGWLALINVDGAEAALARDEPALPVFALGPERTRPDPDEDETPIGALVSGRIRARGPAQFERDEGRLKASWDLGGDGPVRCTLIDERGGGAARLRAMIDELLQQDQLIAARPVLVAAPAGNGLLVADLLHGDREGWGEAQVAVITSAAAPWSLLLFHEGPGHREAFVASALELGASVHDPLAAPIVRAEVSALLHRGALCGLEQISVHDGGGGERITSTTLAALWPQAEGSPALRSHDAARVERVGGRALLAGAYVAERDGKTAALNVEVTKGALAFWGTVDGQEVREQVVVEDAALGPSEVLALLEQRAPGLRGPALDLSRVPLRPGDVLRSGAAAPVPTRDPAALPA